MRFSPVIVGRGHPDFRHVACFEEFGGALAKALKDLGHELCEVIDEKGQPTGARIIAIGANNMRDVDGSMPEDFIAYNSEQVAAIEKPHLLMWAHEQYRNRVVWDYSKANIETLKKMGLQRVVHCPVTYHPSMECIQPAEKDVDVLFYGSVDKWRRNVLNAIDDTGLKVKSLFGVYGKERDSWIARSKIVLNMHYYKAGIFEVFRCSHLWANRVCVVTEGDGRDAELEALAKETSRYVPRSKSAIVDACRELINNDWLRHEQAERGYEVFKRTSLVESVRKALEQS